MALDLSLIHTKLIKLRRSFPLFEHFSNSLLFHDCFFIIEGHIKSV